MKSLKRWWSRFNNPVQVGDVWEKKDINPFNTRETMEVVDKIGYWVRCVNRESGHVFEWHVSSVQFYYDFISEKQ